MTKYVCQGCGSTNRPRYSGSWAMVKLPDGTYEDRPFNPFQRYFHVFGVETTKSLTNKKSKKTTKYKN